MSLKVIHLPSNTGSNAWYLSMGEKNFIESDVLLLERKGIGVDYINTQKRDITIQYSNLVEGIIKIFFFYATSLNRYDIYHFNSGRTLLTHKIGFIDMLDLRLLKLFKKKIVMTYQGGTGRLKSTYALYNQGVATISENGLFINETSDKVKNRRINKVLKYADLIYSTNPDLLVNFNGKGVFRPYTKMELSVNKDLKKRRNNLIVFGHAPSTMERKGTSIIEECIYKLMQDGYAIDYIRLNGLKNEELLTALSQIDVMIDQLFAGWYGGIAVECWNSGIPVMSYISDISLKYLPEEMKVDLPVIKTTHKTLRNDIISLINNPDQLSALSEQSNNYVRKYHDINSIAQDIIKGYKKLFREELK